MTDKCPVCGGNAERDNTTGFDGIEVRCPRCGHFKVSGTALEMLPRRLKDEMSVARVSHAIRQDVSGRPDQMLTSANLDEFLSRPLPGVTEQLNALVRHVAAELGENRLGSTSPGASALLGTTGAVNVDGLATLISYAVKEGLLEQRERRIGLTLKGWQQVDDGQSHQTNRGATVTTTSDEITRAHCNTCQGERNAHKRASFTKTQTDGVMSSSDTYEVLQCAGCDGLSVRKTFWFSEWDEIAHDPDTGEMTMIPGRVVTSWPAPVLRAMPSWVAELTDDSLRSLLEEVYNALNQEMVVLAAIGTRTLLDYAMSQDIGDPPGGFAGKLSAMVAGGHLSSNERDTMEALIDAGNAAAHRAFAPSRETLQRIVEAVENFLHRRFIVQASAAHIRSATPRRPPRTP